MKNLLNTFYYDFVMIALQKLRLFIDALDFSNIKIAW